MSWSSVDVKDGRLNCLVMKENIRLRLLCCFTCLLYAYRESFLVCGVRGGVFVSYVSRDNEIRHRRHISLHLKGFEVMH